MCEAASFIGKSLCQGILFLIPSLALQGSLFFPISSSKCISCSESIFFLFGISFYQGSIFFLQSKEFQSTLALSFNILERAAKYVFEQQFWLLHLLLSDCWSCFLYGVFDVNLCLSVTNLDSQVEGGEWKRKTGYKVYRSALLAQKHEPRKPLYSCCSLCEPGHLSTVDHHPKQFIQAENTLHSSSFV